LGPAALTPESALALATFKWRAPSASTPASCARARLVMSLSSHGVDVRGLLRVASEVANQAMPEDGAKASVGPRSGRSSG
jgi:hypothetical protein